MSGVVAICRHPECSDPAGPGKLCDLCPEHRRLAGQESMRAVMRAKGDWQAGSRTITKAGYARVRLADYSPWVPEHRVAMERILERPLRKGESVHHKNGVRDDNRDANLELWIGGARYGQRASELVCPHCGAPYLVLAK